MPVTQFYRQPGLGTGSHEVALSKIQKAAGSLKVESLSTELCFYVDRNKDHVIKEEEKNRLLWLLGTPFEEQNIAEESFLPSKPSSCECLIEIGPRLNFSTAFSTNAVSMCRSIGLDDVTRIEYSTRYLVTFTGTPSEAGDGTSVFKAAEVAVVAALHDRMTQCRYTEPLTSFALTVKPEEVYEVDIMGQGKEALIKANADLGLAFDDWDLEYYTNMFRDKVNRNPTSVECFDLAQSNSEHSRHWFFKGRMVLDGTECDKSLFQMVMDTQEHSNDNNVIKFSDNSSAIKGYPVKVLCPQKTAVPSPFSVTADKERNIIFTAETHNFPTGVAPFPGATTGTGGRIRDVQATGRGAHVVAGTAGYSFGNLHIPGYDLPWEDTSFEYPDNFASGLEVAIEASNGASDYGNKFGEPILTGFARSYGLRLPNGERREWVKPIMFSGGMGSMDARHSKKEDPEVDMAVVKVGGPVYRIGVGGGAASSIEVQGDNAAHLDFGAVQRGDAEMEQKMNRVIRACIEQTEGDENPICSIHDQGAGGNGNVLKEICEPVGAEIQVSAFQLADPTLSVLELWGAEYQESNALLVRPEHKALLTKIGQREKCDVSFVGKITGDGKIRLVDNRDKVEGELPSGKRIRRECQYPVDLELEHVMGSMPRKVFKFDRVKPSVSPVSLPEGLSVRDALDRVLRLPAVASKRYLTNKVDRSVTGLVAQQQCVGPLHTPLADVAVTALSYFNTVGSATSIGEQPIKGLLDPGRGARMSVGEALTNLVWAPISALKDVKCSGNWMWAAKLPGEGAALVDACVAMCDVMSSLGVAIDGGKDSLSMAARVGKDTVKAPGALVVSAYAACPDITAVVTPDLKCPSGKGSLIYVPLGGENHRLGGSALVQCFGQIGDVAPDMDSTDLFVKAFNVTQSLIKEKKISSGHDVSDGGLVTCILEMAFAGNCGLKVDLPFSGNTLEVLFAEELGLVMEVTSEQLNDVINAYRAEGVNCVNIGHSVSGQSTISISVAGTEVLSGSVGELRDVWEATSVQLEQLQTNPRCVRQEAEGLRDRRAPGYKMNFNPDELLKCDLSCPTAPQVAVIREEGSNGDREMVAAFHMAGFQVWDVNMQDLCTGRQTLNQFRGVVFVGGFSYADVCGSAKGWAATMKYNDQVRAEFDRFYARQDTFSLGVCNGCQLMALLGWVAPAADKGQGVLFTHNISERYESRFTTVAIDDSPAVMLKGMQGSTLGIWVAHGEGRVQFKTNGIQEEVTSQGLVPIKYVDDAGQATTTYPLNPNGSPGGAAAICSTDGRHLAMMPHPERCVLPWQWAWKPADWSEMKTSPWLCMFKNAYKWCLENVE